VGSLAVEVLDENVGTVWLEGDAVVTVDDVGVCDGDRGAAVDVPSV
jgi:hypothetical protein